MEELIQKRVNKLMSTYILKTYLHTSTFDSTNFQNQTIWYYHIDARPSERISLQIKPAFRMRVWWHSSDECMAWDESPFWFRLKALFGHWRRYAISDLSSNSLKSLPQTGEVDVAAATNAANSGSTSVFACFLMYAGRVNECSMSSRNSAW